MRTLRSLIVLLPVAACSGADCVALPCPATVAIMLTISPPTSGGSVPVASVDVSGPTQMSFSCNATCPIAGPAGTYHIAVSASGFTSVERTVEVRGTSPRCGCASTVTENVTIALSTSARHLDQQHMAGTRAE